MKLVILADYPVTMERRGLNFLFAWWPYAENKHNNDVKNNAIDTDCLLYGFRSK